MSSSSSAPEVTIESLQAELATYKKCEKKLRSINHPALGPRHGLNPHDPYELCKRLAKHVEAEQERSNEYVIETEKFMRKERKKTRKLEDKLAELASRKTAGTSQADTIVTSVAIISVIMLAYYAFNGCK